MKRIPIYKQIREYILDQLHKQTWQANDQLPSENELSAQFNVSRITIKNALSSLVEEGLIYRIQGKGTFISENAGGEKPTYKPSSPATDTSTGRAHAPRLIGYLTSSLNYSFTTSLLSEVEATLAQQGYHLVFACSHQSQELEEKILRDFVNIGAEGIIVHPVEGETFNEEILRLTLSNFPLVVIDRYLRGVETNCVCSDNVQGGYEATKHLLELGHTHIGFISTQPLGTTSIEDRLMGYEKALSEWRIPMNMDLKLTQLKVYDPENEEAIKAFLHKQKNMTAVVAVNSTIGLQVLNSAAALGIQIPESMSVVMFDDPNPLKTQPTYMKQQAEEIAHEAVRLLLHSINNPTGKKKRVEYPTSLVIGDTTANGSETSQ